MKNWRGKLGWVIILTLFFANIAVWYAVYQERPDGILRVSFLDVGQGDAILILAPNRNQVLIDGGPGRGTLRALGRVLPFYDRSIDLVVATHPDADHIGGLPDVFRRFRVAGVLDTDVSAETDFYDLYVKEREAESATRIVAQSGLRVILDDDVYFDIFWPSAGTTRLETNDASVTGRLVYGDTAFMLTGDLSEKYEKILVESYGKKLESTVLKAGHHGSNTSSGKSFVGFVAPDYAIISAGRDNRYGHPHASVLETFVAIGAKVLRTDEMGTITFKSDGRTVMVE